MILMPDAVKHYDGTKGKFNGMVASLLVFLGAVDFILTSAPSHYVTLSDTLKAESDSSVLEFTQYFGPMNLRIAHKDIINILLSIFSKFSHTKEFVHAEIIHKHSKFPATNTWDSVRTAYIASNDFVCNTTRKLLTLDSPFNGDNWPSLDTELGLSLEAVSDSDLTIRGLVAMHLLHGIQVASQKNNTWAAAHPELIKMKNRLAQDNSRQGQGYCQNTRPRCQLPTAADPPLFCLFVRPAVDYSRPKMQELPWLSAALR